MKKRFKMLLLFAVALIAAAFTCSADQDPWTPKQLLEPADLAKTLNDAAAPKPIILNIGSVGDIKGAESIGAAGKDEGVESLKKKLSTLPKDANIVIYCGCCPFADCPNIRPAFSLLNEMKFTHHKLLDLPDNLKVDWIDKGYPMND